MKKEISGRKIIYAIITIAIGGIIAYFGQPLIHGNDQAVDAIITVFSILAGFLVAIIAIIGDPMLLPPGSWRAAEMGLVNVNKRLIRHKWLFILYLITLCAVFISILIKDSSSPIGIWIERAYLFLSAVAFIFSLWLPGTLMRMQQERIDREIEHRRHEAGIGPSFTS